jgi:hypothetical protein
MIRFMRALAATVLQCIGLHRIADKFDPVLDNAIDCQAPKHPYSKGARPTENGGNLR